MTFWAQDLLQFAIATTIGPLLACIVAASAYWMKIAPQLDDPLEPIPDTAKMDGRQLVGTGLPFLFASAALVINVRVEKLLLGMLATPEDVAIFQIAWLGFIAGYGPILSLRAVLLSWFGEVRGDLEKMKHRYKLAFLSCAILCPIGALIGIVVGPFAFDALFSDYADVVAKPFRWLLLAWLFHAIASPSLALIQTSEKPWNYTRILWGGIVVSLLLCFYLISTQTDPVAGAVKAAAISSIFVFVIATSLKNTGAELSYIED
jgi:O-antigen/teichoic acid export membrane protein